jgi:fibronectin-binding autotransporter adhesin
MNRAMRAVFGIGIVAVLGSMGSITRGSISQTGNVYPSDPARWKASTTAYVGRSGTGGVTIDDDSDVISKYGHIGDQSGSTGTVSLTGSGTTWTLGDTLYVAYSGDGALDITDGAAVSTTRNVTIGYYADSTGVMTVNGAESNCTSAGLRVGVFGRGELSISDGGMVVASGNTIVASYGESTGMIYLDNGTLTTGGFVGSVSGTGTINTGGLVGDTGLVFDAAHGPVQTLSLGGPDSNVTVNLDIDGLHPMGAGHSGEGSIHISDGVTLQSSNGYLGHQSGSRGVATISGNGSTWICPVLDVGNYGKGELDIEAGSAVSGSYGSIGKRLGSSGAVTISGSGATWTNSENFYVGQVGQGVLDITAGGVVANKSGHIAFTTESTGTATVSGTGSRWTNSVDLHVGDSGNGELNISNGGLVEVGRSTYVAKSAGSSGVINFDNGTLTTGDFFGVANGEGTINTKGLVVDADLVFDATHGFAQTITLGGPGRNITINLDIDGSGSMGVGHGGEGSMNISDGVTLQSYNGYLGYQFGSSGAATVSGDGSTWAVSTVNVALRGDGKLDITDGGTVNSAYTLIGVEPGSTGTVTISGPGSTWTNSGTRNIGDAGHGVMNITNGGVVSNHYGNIGVLGGSSGVVKVSGDGSTWINYGDLTVGSVGNGDLEIINGASVINANGLIGARTSRGYSSTGVAIVSGKGSTWINSGDLHVGNYGAGSLNIVHDGLVRVAGRLIIDGNRDNDSFITMDSGGMLALKGQADDSLGHFLSLTPFDNDDIRYWDDSVSDWVNITSATEDEDYTLVLCPA